MALPLSFHVPRFEINPLPQPELRKDPVLDRWVIISTDRLGRPSEYCPNPPSQSLSACPFCAGHEHMTPEPTYVDPPSGQWRVRVIPNTFPAVRGDNRPPGKAADVLTCLPACGRHEVVIACPQHEASLARLTESHLAAMFRAFRERVRALMRERPELYPFIFNNHRAAAGASLEHAHAQLIALAHVPDLVASESRASHLHLEQHGRCVYCEMVDRELAVESRIVMVSRRFVVLAAFAARFPCEVWLVPRAHSSHFEKLSDADLIELGSIFHRLLVKLDRGLDDPPFNFVIHTAPPGEPESRAYHWHLELLPRLTGAAGFEWGTGMNINPVPPEQAAAYLRGIDAG